jgi:hypothetical protein
MILFNLNHATRRIAAIVAVMLMAAAAPAHASLFDEPYSVDRGYANGTFTDDAFASDSTLPNKYFVGKKVIRLNNDIVVAALVKHPNSNQDNGHWNLGLVRYNASGTQRLAWSNPTPAYSNYLDQYIVYPNSGSATIREVQDLRTINQKIYVLVNDQYTASIDVNVSRILVFGADGTFISSSTPFSVTTNTTADTSNYAGGLATYTDLVANKRYLVVVATRFVPGTGRGRPVFRRYEIGASGDLAASTGTVELNTSACWNAAWECHVRAIEANSLYSPMFYVAYAYRPNTSTGNWNIVVSRIDTNGNGDGSWDPNNVSWGLADGGSFSDWPVGLEVRTPPSSGAFRDEIYVVAESERNCQSGIGVLRFDHDGNVVASRLFGGDTSTGTACNSNSRRFDRPQAIVTNATNTPTISARLAIVGYTGISYVVGPPTNATLTVLDADLVTRDTRDFRSPLNSTNNYGTRFPALYGVVSDDSGAFIATGSLAYPSYTDTPENLRGKTNVTTVRFAADRIFGDDME